MKMERKTEEEDEKSEVIFFVFALTSERTQHSVFAPKRKEMD